MIKFSKLKWRNFLSTGNYNGLEWYILFLMFFLIISSVNILNFMDGINDTIILNKSEITDLVRDLESYDAMSYVKQNNLSDKNFESTFLQNGWANNWHDIILTEDHFHSNTHEVLGLKRGQARLMLGGRKGKMVNVDMGDVIILPAGVGHYSVDHSMDYQFVGGYPNGADWNLKFSLKKENSPSILAEIANIPLPEKDPIFGDNGPLFEFWH